MSLTVTATESTAVTAAVSLCAAARADGSPTARSARMRKLRMRISPAKSPRDEIAHAQPPGINSQRGIYPAGARENASICHVEAVDPVHLAVCTYYGIAGVSPANQGTADMGRSIQADPARE